MKKYSEIINESENINDNDDILVIVDVQKSFGKYIPNDFEKKLANYCQEFKQVYQIWDSNKVDKESYNFPNQVKSIRKNYGTKFSNDIVNLSKQLEQNNPEVKEGDKFKVGDRQYMVKIDNNHKWFYVNQDLYDLYKELNGFSVVIVGGASEECLEDVYVSMESFGVNAIYNHEYIYSAQTSNKQQATL